MATSLNAQPMVFGDGVEVDSQNLRVALAALLTSAGPAGTTGLAASAGVRLTANGTPLQVTAGSGMSVNVAAGQAWIRSTAGDSGGAYQLTLPSSGALTVAAANPSLPRIDAVFAQINDVGSGSSTATVNIVTGTASSSPSAPATPSGAIALGYVNVAAGATSVTVTDERTYTTGLGAILPVVNSAGYPANAAASDYGHNLATGRLVLLTGSSAARAPLTALFAPQSATGNTPSATNATWQAGPSVSVTTDGISQVRVDIDCQNLQFGGAVSNICYWGILMDGSPVKTYDLVIVETGGGNFFSGAMGYIQHTPAAGTHTYAVGVATNGASGVEVQAFTCSITANAVSV
jgi:hypothetical protein